MTGFICNSIFARDVQLVTNSIAETQTCIGKESRNAYRVLIRRDGQPTRLVYMTRAEFRSSAVNNKRVYAPALANPAPRAHKSEFGTLITYRNMVKFKVAGEQPRHLRFTSRGTVNIEFNGKARKRLLDKMNAWRIPGVNMIFAHTTYPAEYPHDWRIWKNDLKRLKQMMLRKFTNIQGIWKLELQRRGAPHYHMIIDLGQACSITRFRQWLDAAWARIAHQNDQYGGKYACRADIIFSMRHALNYGAKYLNKANQAPIDEDGVIMDAEALNGATIGRHWGVIGKLDCRPTAYVPRFKDHAEFMRLKFAEELQKIGSKKWLCLITSNPNRSFTVYGAGDSPNDNNPSIMGLIQEWFDDENLFTDEYANIVKNLRAKVNPTAKKYHF